MTPRNGRVLVVDDDGRTLAAARQVLKRRFAVVQTESDPAKVPDLVELGFDVVLLDTAFARGAGRAAGRLDWLRRILEIDPGAVVVPLAAQGDVGTALRAIEAGATDFVLKPWQNDKLVATVSAALALRAARDEAARLRARERALVDAANGVPPTLIGRARTMRALLDLVRRAAPTDANVLILGERGSGKELLARMLHSLSPRAAQLFVPVDLRTSSEALLERELFGHRKGAFTDASDDRAGRLQAASRGTLYLREIGRLPPPLQGKLLNALEQRAVTPIGADRTMPVDVRLVSAASEPIDELARAHSLREDLLYRIDTVEIRVPPLRARREDIAPLVEHFVSVQARKHGLPAKRLSRGALKRLENYAWPGNVGELRRAVERAMLASDSPTLGARDLLPADGAPRSAAAPKLDGYNLEAAESRVIETALEKHAGNVSRAARELGITRASLYRRMDKHGL